MAITGRSDHAEIGTQLPPARFCFTREGQVRYSCATRDFNPINWDRAAARECGLADTISHGMLVFAEALRVVSAWAGDPAAITEYELSFANPLLVPDDGNGAFVDVEAKIGGKLPDGQVRLELDVTCDGRQLTRGASVVVRL